MCLFLAYRFDDPLDTTGDAGSINVLYVSYLLDADIHRDCGLVSLAHLYPKWAGERMIVLCRFSLTYEYYL